MTFPGIEGIDPNEPSEIIRQAIERALREEEQ